MADHQDTIATAALILQANGRVPFGYGRGEPLRNASARPSECRAVAETPSKDDADSRTASPAPSSAINVVSIAVILAFAPQLDAQYVDSGIWLGGFVTGKLPSSMNDAKGSWRVWMDGQLRFGDDSSHFSQGLVRPGVGYALNKAWSLWAGYAHIRTDQPYAKAPSNENRIWEQVSWQRLVGSTDLSSRTRLEQRFHSAGSGTGVRLREMGKLIQPLGAKKIWLFVVYDEIFVNVNSTNFGARSGADRNRAFAGPGINLSRSGRAELGYMNQYTFNNNGPDRIDHIFSISYFWNFSRGSPPEE